VIEACVEPAHKPEPTFGNVNADVLADEDPHFARGNFVARCSSSRQCRCVRASDLDHAPGTRNDSESESVQLYDRSYQIQTKTEA
jgi:hypothetical protein